MLRIFVKIALGLAVLATGVFAAYDSRSKASSSRSAEVLREENTLITRSENSIVSTTQEQESIRLQIVALQKLADEKIMQANAFREGRISHLSVKIRELELLIDIARQKELQQEAVLHRTTDLFNKKYVTESVYVTASSGAEISRLDREMNENKLKLLNIELKAAQAGTFIGEGYNDISYSRQRADELAIKVSDLQLEVVRKETVLRQQQVELAALESRRSLVPDTTTTAGRMEVMLSSLPSLSFLSSLGSHSTDRRISKRFSETVPSSPAPDKRYASGNN